MVRTLKGLTETGCLTEKIIEATSFAEVKTYNVKKIFLDKGHCLELEETENTFLANKQNNMELEIHTCIFIQEGREEEDITLNVITTHTEADGLVFLI